MLGSGQPDAAPCTGRHGDRRRKARVVWGRPPHRAERFWAACAVVRQEGTDMSADELHPTRPISNGVSRRGVLRLGGAGLAATALGGATVHRAGADVASVGIPIEPDAGEWKTWLLSRGDQFR